MFHKTARLLTVVLGVFAPAITFAAFVGPSQAPPMGNVPGVVWNRVASDPSQAQVGVEYNVGGDARIGKDLFLSDSKALRIDQAGDSSLNIGNWQAGKFTLNVIGDIKTDSGDGSEGKVTAYKYCIGPSCITSWPSSGMDKTTADGLYVDVAGDTMTGGLTVTPGSGTAGTFNGQTWGVRGFGDTSGGFFRNEVNTSYSANLGLNGYGGYFNAPTNQLSLYSTQNAQVAGKLGVGINPSASSAKLQISGSVDPLLAVSSNTYGQNTAIHLQYNGSARWYLWSKFDGGDFNIGSPSVNPALTIKPFGQVGIGTTSPDQRLTVNGAASKPGGGSWSTFSDERLKKLYGSYDRGLEDLLKLHPLWYEYRQGNKMDLPTDGPQVGFSAQQVQKIIPEAVVKGESGYLYLNNDPILWTMLNAIKELKAENDALNDRLDELEKQR